jgi:hypothetical protein
MSCVYRNGYYLEMPVRHLASYIHRYVAGSCPQTSSDIAEIITYCGELGIFDRELLSQSVITSREIQEHYSYVSARRKADRSKYWLLPEDNDRSAEKHSSPSETAINASQNGINAAEIPIHASQNGINAAEIPQSKGNKSKGNKSKANKTKQNESKAIESKAIESKAKQSKHASADEIFCDPAYANAADEPADAFAIADDDAGYSEAENAYDDDCFSDADADAEADDENDCYADDDADADAEYGEIAKAYYDAVGRHLNDADRADIDTIRHEGADDMLILYALKRVAARRQTVSIHSFRYFLPVIRDMLRENSQKAAPAAAPPYRRDRGFIHNDTVYDDPYAHCTTTEEYLDVLDREFRAAQAW